VENFTPLSALVGGLLIGLGAAVLLLGGGRIAGISGIVGGMLKRPGGDYLWRACFVVGLLIGAGAYAAFAPDRFVVQFDATAGTVAARRVEKQRSAGSALLDKGDEPAMQRREALPARHQVGEQVPAGGPGDGQTIVGVEGAMA